MATVALPDLGPGELLPVPHLVWHRGRARRASRLTEGTRRLLRAMLERKREPTVRPEEAEAYARRQGEVLAGVIREVSEAGAAVRRRLPGWTETMFASLDRHAEHHPEADPFREVDVAALCEPPDHLPDAAAWPFLLGALVARAEADLGWRRRRGRADLRAWAALAALAHHWARASFAEAREAIRDYLAAGDLSDLERDGTMAGMWLMACQRAVVAGYREATEKG